VNTPSVKTSDPIVKVFVLLVRNPLLSKDWGTLLRTTDKKLVEGYRAQANRATEFKVRTALFRKSTWERLSSS